MKENNGEHFICLSSMFMKEKRVYRQEIIIHINKLLSKSIATDTDKLFLYINWNPRLITKF